MEAFWEKIKLPFQEKKMTYEEGVDYSFTDFGRYGVGVEILTGKFKGVIYSYGKVSFEEVDGNGVLHIEFEVIDPLKFNDLKENCEFITIIGDILTGILMKQGADG